MSCINLVKVYREDENTYDIYLKVEFKSESPINICTARSDFNSWVYIDYFIYAPENKEDILKAFKNILEVIYDYKLIVKNIKAFEKILRRVYEQYGHDYYWNSRNNVNNANCSNKH